jgi:arylformamidase
MKTKVIDLTHLMNEGMPVYPDTVPPVFESYNTIPKDGFAELKMILCTHIGTHIDAPCHILERAKSLDRFPLEKFIGDAIVIPCQNMDEIGVEFLLSYKEKISQIEFVLFYTGCQRTWGTPDYFGDFPTLSREATQWLAGFELKGVGFDAISADKIVPVEEASSESLGNHRILLGKEILLIENLTNLDLLPSGTFSFHCVPLKVENADGSPVRALAIIRESDTSQHGTSPE